MNLLSGFGSSASKSLIIRFIADTAKASRKIDNLANKVKRIQGGGGIGSYTGKGIGFQQGLARYTAGLARMGDVGSESFSKISSGAMKATGAIVAFGIAMKKSFDMGTMVENSLVALEVLQGSAEKARETMKMAMDFSLKTPFKPREVLAATQAAAQYNIDLYKKGKYGLGKDQNVAQILAGMGSFVDLRGNKIGMGRATHAVMRGDYRLLRQYRGLVNPAFEEAKTAGKVGTPEFTRKFIEGLGKIPQIMDMAKRQSETVSGLWSTIAGSMDVFWTKFTGASEKKGVVTMWAHVRDILFEVREGILNLIDYIGPSLTDIGAVLGAFFKVLWKIGKFVGTVLGPAFKVVLFIVRAIAVVLEWVFSAIGKVLDFFIKIYDKIKDVIGAFTDMDNKQKQKGPGLFEDAIAFLKAQLMLADVMLDWALNALWERISELIDAFGRFIKSVASGKGILQFYKEERAYLSGKSVERQKALDREANEVFLEKHATDAHKRIINAPLSETDKDLINEGVKTEEEIRNRRTTTVRENAGGNTINNNYYKIAPQNENKVNFGKPESVR